MKILFISLLLFLSPVFAETSKAEHIRKISKDLRSKSVVYITKTHQENGVWKETVEKLFIKKRAKLTKTLKSRLVGPGQEKLPKTRHKRNSRNFWFISNSVSASYSFHITEEEFLELLTKYNFEEKREVPE